MSDKPWKRFEREVADLVQGSRFWANSGEAVDVEGPQVVVQCKNVKTMSLSALSALAHHAAQQGAARGKLGLVAVKCRQGRGRSTPTLIVMTADTWRVIIQPEEEHHEDRPCPVSTDRTSGQE